MPVALAGPESSLAAEFYAVARKLTERAEDAASRSGEVIEIDSRPSDAIALSVHFDPVLPIYVEDSVLGEVA